MVVIILHFCIDNDSAADSEPENALLPQQFNSSSLTLSASHHEGVGISSSAGAESASHQMISAEGDVEDEVVQTAESEGQDVKRVRKRPTRLDFKPEDMGYKGTKLGVRQGGSLRPSGTSLDFPDVSQVARLRGLAAQHADDSELASALQEAAETIELQGVEIEDLKGQLRKFKTMLTQHNTTLMGMEDTECVTDSRILKALQAFILDIMDAAEIPDHAHVGVIGADGKHGAAEMLADVEADAKSKSRRRRVKLN